MALPTRADVVGYLRLNAALATGTPADPLLAQAAAFLDRLLAEATALVERRLGVPIVAVERTMTVEVGDRPVAGAWPWGAWSTTPRALFLPLYPVATSPAPIVTDQDGAVVDAATYTVDPLTGRVAAGDAYYFVGGTYTVTATVGLSAAPDYATAIEPVLSGAILDVVADRYQNREPGYSTVNAGGGVSRTHYAGGLPPRAEDALASFARLRV